jgi:hypothetical protein
MKRLGDFAGLEHDDGTDAVEIWYMTTETWEKRRLTLSDVPEIDPQNIAKTHALLGTIKRTVGEFGRPVDREMSNIMTRMQAEMWADDPQSARKLLESKKLVHTSMSVGDIMVFRDGVRRWIRMIGMRGFIPIGS